VQPRALAAQHKNAIGLEVELGVVRCAALVKSNYPDVPLLQLLQRANKVGHAGDSHVLRRSSGGLSDRCCDRGGPALGQHNAVDASGVGCAKERPEVVWIFNPVERKQERMLPICFRGK